MAIPADLLQLSIQPVGLYAGQVQVDLSVQQAPIQQHGPTVSTLQVPLQSGNDLCLPFSLLSLFKLYLLA